MVSRFERQDQSDLRKVEDSIKSSAKELLKKDNVMDGNPARGEIGKVPYMEPVRSVDVPEGWALELEMPGVNRMSASVIFRPIAAPDAVLSIYYRGNAIASGEAACFKDLLESKPHVLAEDEKALVSRQIIGNLSDASAFAIETAATRDLAGRRTLFIEGTWRQGGKKFHGFLVPKDETFSRIQEIFFEAPEPNFSKYLALAVKAIDSIKWRHPD